MGHLPGCQEGTLDYRSLYLYFWLSHHVRDYRKNRHNDLSLSWAVKSGHKLSGEREFGHRPARGFSGRGPCLHGASRDENPGLGRGPSGGHVQIDRGLLPSNPEKTPSHRDEAGPSRRPDTVGESNNLHATCNGFSPHTNNRLSTRTRE
jgi:hypothetical protein